MTPATGSRRWPAELVVLRHGQSTANAAVAAADAAGRVESGITGRDADVPLSPLGRRQARQVGSWLAHLPAARFPEVIISSPYRRATETLDVALAGLTHADHQLPPIRVDERLRDRDNGALELLTMAAVRQRFPEELDRRRQAGEFHYRPEGGESLIDVGYRLRGLHADLCAQHAGRRVLIVAHDAIVLMLRHVIEDLPIQVLGRVMASGPVANASVTRWVSDPDGLRLSWYNKTVDRPPAVLDV